jgi:hypothetical protein
MGVEVEGAGDDEVEARVAASRAQATRSARLTVPYSGPMKMPARRSRLALHVAALGAIHSPGQGVRR